MAVIPHLICTYLLTIVTCPKKFKGEKTKNFEMTFTLPSDHNYNEGQE